MSLSFSVSGIPQAQGGVRPVPTKQGVRLISTGSVGLQEWRNKVTQVAGFAVNLAHWEATGSPVEVELVFFLPMPKSAPKASRQIGIAHHPRKPDLDKLERAILDSLTRAGVYLDDAQVAVLSAAKYQVADHRLCGVEVLVRAVDARDEAACGEALLRRRAALLDPH